LPDEKDFGFLLKANYGYSVVLRELISSSIQVRCTVLNVLTNKRIEISFKEEQRFNYQRLISNLAKGIENEIFYPRPSFGACETCTFKQTCSWRIS
jgi:CRISPR/Cas system-associated exonuclease Cas4 (RecB family)